MHTIFSHRHFKDVDKSNHINDCVSSKKYLEIYLSKIIDRNTEEGEAAWMELCNHHCIPYPKYGRWVLDQFFNDDEEPDPETGSGYLYPYVMNYLKNLDINVDDYDDILLYMDW